MNPVLLNILRIIGIAIFAAMPFFYASFFRKRNPHGFKFILIAANIFWWLSAIIIGAVIDSVSNIPEIGTIIVCIVCIAVLILAILSTSWCSSRRDLIENQAKQFDANRKKLKGQGGTPVSLDPLGDLFSGFGGGNASGAVGGGGHGGNGQKSANTSNQSAVASIGGSAFETLFMIGAGVAAVFFLIKFCGWFFATFGIMALLIIVVILRKT